MSYITLMVNDAGAVAAADSRESFYHLAHMDWLRKAYLLPRRELVFCCCGPSFRHGIPIFRTAAAILRGNRDTMEQQLDRIGAVVAAATALKLPREDPGPFVLLAAQWTGEGFTVYQYHHHRGQPSLQVRQVERGKPLSLHAGAWHQQMPRLSPETLTDLDYDALRALARSRVELAIEKDERRKRQNPRHNQTIGGRVNTCGIRVSGKRSIFVDEKYLP